MLANSDKAYRSGSGKYFSILPSDDFYYPNHLKEHINALEKHPECVLAYSPCYWVDERGSITSLAIHPGHPPFTYYGGRNEVADLLVYDNYISPPAAVIRRKEFVDAGLLDHEVKGAGDWDMWIRLAMNNPNFIYINRASVGYRIHTGQVSNRFYESSDPLDDHLRITEKVLTSSVSEHVLGREERIWRHIEGRVTAHAQYLNDEYTSRLGNIRNELVRMQSENYAIPLDDSPLVSVVIPAFSRPDLLQKTLLSLAQQRYKNWEALVVDDCGENVEDMVLSIIPESRLKYLRHDIHKGIDQARRSAIMFSEGQIICYLDEGICIEAGHLHAVVDVMKSNNDAYAYIDGVVDKEGVLQGDDNSNKRVYQLLCHRSHYDQKLYESPVYQLSEVMSQHRNVNR